MLFCLVFFSFDTRLHFLLLFAGQQSQQPQDYTKAWEEYYKKQGQYFTFLFIFLVLTTCSFCTLTLKGEWYIHLLINKVCKS